MVGQDESDYSVAIMNPGGISGFDSGRQRIPFQWFSVTALIPGGKMFAPVHRGALADDVGISRRTHRSTNGRRHCSRTLGVLALTFAMACLVAGLFAIGSPAEAAPSKPAAANTGVPAGTTLTRYTGPLIISVDGTVIDRKAVYGDLKIRAKNVIVRNSYLHCGTQVPTGNTGCVDANGSTVYNLLVTNNTIIPDRPSYYRDGIVGHEFTARYNHISHTNDGIGIFNRPGGSVNANVTVQGNYIHDLTHWNNDPAHRDGTHNDGIQVQGGQNIAIRGNTIVGSVVAGDGLGVYGTHAGSALIVNQNVAKVANLVVDGNWLDNGQNTVSVHYDKYANVALTMSNNYFGRNQYVFGNGSKYTLRIDSRSKSKITGLGTNRWENNNQLLTEGRDTGIRYMAG